MATKTVRCGQPHSIPANAGIPTKGDRGVLPRLTIRRVTSFRGGDTLGWAVGLSAKLRRGQLPRIRLSLLPLHVR